MPDRCSAAADAEYGGVGVRCSSHTRRKGVDDVMQVEVFSDVVCPWCYIGKRHMEQALEQFPHADQVSVTYRSYQLSPDAPKDSDGTLAEMLSKKYGVPMEQARAMNERVTGVAAEAGLDYHLDEAHPANTFDAHRLLHFAAEHGKQAELKERLMASYFTEAKRIGEADVLVREAEAVGLDGEAARAVLDGTAYTDEVNSDLSLAQAFGISGVPFFVIDRKYGLSGAQPAEVIRQALENAWMESHPLTMVGAAPADADGSADDACADGVCQV
jgi:predicted DsbA family dithiol-disulfide isomerase